ncbi:MAG: uracil-DNA glycosylase [Lentisphaeria bacterium]|nr:uracil-DNA glycosylase [Lentisphaeria bacterium]
MAEFFDQICRILTETAAKYPAQTVNDEAVREFFRDLPKPPVCTHREAVPENKAVPVLPPQIAVKSVKENNIAGSLEDLQKSLANCQRCQLCANRNSIVFGEGNPDARLMFVGEAPGYDEDIQGRPFVGKAGKLLDKMISAMQFTREEIYIANVVKCRPDGNRNPMPDEIEKCIPFLHRQIELIRPEVIVVLGAVAAKALLRTENGISSLRGRWCSYENIPVMPTFHPAYLLRQESAKKEAWQDLQLVMARFGKYHKKN